MAIDSPYIGEWMASAYTERGERIEYRLILSRTGHFEQHVRTPAQEKMNEGSWHHRRGEDLIDLQFDPSPANDRLPTEWWILKLDVRDALRPPVPRFMLLQWTGSTSPILFYRIEAEGA